MCWSVTNATCFYACRVKILIRENGLLKMFMNNYITCLSYLFVYFCCAIPLPMTRWICCHKLSGSVFPKKICLGVGGISFRGKLRRSFVKKALDPCSSVTPRHTVRLLTDPDANEDKSQRSQCMESCNATSSAPSIMLRA